VFRTLYPTTFESYTYWDQKTYARDRNVGWRIDYFFITDKLLKKVKDFKIHSEILGSDHCPIELEIAL
jgi:exodeoxyribonuclease-3